MVVKVKKPVIRHIAKFWSMTEYPSKKREWSLEKKYKAVKEAGFDGVTTWGNEEHGRLCQKYGLTLIGYFSSAKSTEFRKLIQEQKDAGAYHINIQLGDEDTPIEKATQLAIKLMEEGERQGVQPYVEIHRDTATETPEKTYAICEGYYKSTGKLLPLTPNYSHIGVGKHLREHYENFIYNKPTYVKLLQLTQNIHMRPFNGHHCQVPVTNGKGKFTKEFKTWIPFAEKTFELWVKKATPGRELFCCPEMGPTISGYNLSILPNSWEDAIVLKGVLDKLFKKAVKEHWKS